MVAERRYRRSVISLGIQGTRAMAEGRSNLPGAPMFEHIESEIDATVEEEQTVIHGDTGTDIENASPIGNNSISQPNTPGNVRSRGYSGKKDLATPPGEDRPQTGANIKEFRLTPGSVLTEGSARVYTAGSPSESGSQGTSSSKKTPIRQTENAQ